MRAEPRLLLATGALLVGCSDEPSFSFCPAPIVLNEVMAAGERDWIELFNESDTAHDLTGFGLSTTDWSIDWELPPLELAAGGFLHVWADEYVVEGELSTGFDLNRDGDSVYLRAPAADRRWLCDAVHYPDQHEGFAWARATDAGTPWCDAAENTPGGPNVGCF